MSLKMTIHNNPSDKVISSGFAAMAVTHSISKYQEMGELLGRPIDIEMFKFSKGKISNSNDSVKMEDVTLRIETRFWFCRETRMMGVIASDKEERKLFVKGDPEKIM